MDLKNTADRHTHPAEGCRSFVEESLEGRRLHHIHTAAVQVYRIDSAVAAT